MAIPTVNGTITTNGAYSSNTVDTTTFTHPVAAGLANSMLVVFTSNREPDGQPMARVDSITYDGVALTQVLDEVYLNGFPNNIQTAIYYLVNPHSGTNDVTINWTEHPNSALTTVITLQNAGPIDVYDFSTSSTQATITKTTNYNNELALCSVYAVSEAFTAFGAGQTEISNFNGGSAYYQNVTRKDVATAGSVTMTSTIAHNTYNISALVSVRELDFVPQLIII